MKRDQWIRDLLSGSWLEEEYPEGTVAGVIFDAWLCKLGPEKARDHLSKDGPGEPQETEIWDAARLAGVLKWEAYPPGEVNNMVGMAEEAGAYACIEQSELDNCGDDD